MCHVANLAKMFDLLPVVPIDRIVKQKPLGKKKEKKMRLLQSKSTIKFLESFLRNYPLNSDQLKRRFASISEDKKITYNTPHPPKDPPENYNPEQFDHPAFSPPDCVPLAVFRPFSSSAEILGPNASKTNDYKNPEYYSYHRYSFVALQVRSLELRLQSPALVDPVDEESSGEELTSSDEEIAAAPCKKEESDGSSSSGSEEPNAKSESGCPDA
uniref:Uncharacterized protein n=1 Tax=Glossina austeni TaxID=7395 RepID=A0A1A9V836_GLOAU